MVWGTGISSRWLPWRNPSYAWRALHPSLGTSAENLRSSKLTDFYDKRGVSPDEVAEAVLRAISKHTLIVPVPRRQVLVPYLLHRLSPDLLQPIARAIARYVGRM